VKPPKLTILTADTDAACDPETGTCTIPQTPIPSPGAAPAAAAVLPGMGKTPPPDQARTCRRRRVAARLSPR
jgi:hypothetical protein